MQKPGSMTFDPHLREEAFVVFATGVVGGGLFSSIVASSIVIEISSGISYAMDLKGFNDRRQDIITPWIPDMHGVRPPGVNVPSKVVFNGKRMNGEALLIE
jgi:hypothetical protein